MKQIELKKLLIEATEPGCSEERRDEILQMLKECTNYMGADWCMISGHRAAPLQLFIKELFTGTLKNRPELLPSLFPAFAVLCGDREKKTEHTIPVEWELVD